MKVFIAWSGEVSHQVATALRDWLPQVVQSIKPFVSSEDIEKGSQWAESIREQLETSSFGILCLTQTNVAATWVHFEAGVLSGMTEKTRVCPFLFRVQGSKVKGPLSLFQATEFIKEDVKKLLDTLNKNEEDESRLGEVRLQEAFEKWWPDLEKRLNGIVEPEAAEPSDGAASTSDGGPNQAILEEILKLLRGQQRILSSQEEIKLGRLLKENIRMVKRQCRALDRLAGPANPHRRTGQPLGESDPLVHIMAGLASGRSLKEVVAGLDRMDMPSAPFGRARPAPPPHPSLPPRPESPPRPKTPPAVESPKE